MPGTPTVPGKSRPILGVQQLMAFYSLTPEQAKKAGRIIHEPNTPFTDPEVLEQLKEHYMTDSNYQAELHWMVERGIIDPDDTTGRWSLVAFTCAGAASISVPATETKKANSFFSGIIFG